MKVVYWFQTDLGYEATRQKLFQQIIIGDMEGYKGRLTFYLKDLKDITIQITTKGKLGIACPETVDYNLVLEKLKPLIVRADGSPIQQLKMITKVEKPLAIARGSSPATLRHSENLLREITEDALLEDLTDVDSKILNYYLFKNPGDVLDRLVLHRGRYSALLEHLSLYKEFETNFQNYYQLCAKYNFPKIHVSGDLPGKIGFLDVEWMFNGDEDSGENCQSAFSIKSKEDFGIVRYGKVKYIPGKQETGITEEVKKDFDQLIKLRKLLVDFLQKIMTRVKDGLPLKGICRLCLNEST